ncbi:MAG: DUF2520 domain-containing protein [Bdellovibrionota bacterium]
MATQFLRALVALNIPHSQWHRTEETSNLITKTQKATRVVLLIPDKAIHSFVDDHSELLKNKTLIHFSATLNDSRILGFHPLGMFNKDQKINFEEIQFHGPHPESLFREALPFLKNSYKELSPQEMQLYHALCVVGGNFSAILWNAFFKEMKKLGVSNSAAQSYFKLFTQNVVANPSTSVTGPLARNDTPTLEKNIAALKACPELQSIYKAFVETFTQTHSHTEYLK